MFLQNIVSHNLQTRVSSYIIIFHPSFSCWRNRWRLLEIQSTGKLRHSCAHTHQGIMLLCFHHNYLSDWRMGSLTESSLQCLRCRGNRMSSDFVCPVIMAVHKVLPVVYDHSTKYLLSKQGELKHNPSQNYIINYIFVVPVAQKGKQIHFGGKLNLC